MSWFKRSPRVREPDKGDSKTTSPMTEKLLKETKDFVRGTEPKKNKKEIK